MYILSQTVYYLCMQTQMFFTCFSSDRLGYDNDFAWEEARYPGSRNGLTHFRRLDDQTLAFSQLKKQLTGIKKRRGEWYREV